MSALGALPVTHACRAVDVRACRAARPRSAAAPRRRQLRRGRRQAAENSDAVSASDSLRVSGLTPLDELCDEFVCKSSPAIESTLRQIARDIDNVREGEARSAAPYAENVAYSDALGASLRGRDNLRAYAPLRANLQNARAAVTSMVRFAAHDGTLALELTPAPLAKRMEGLDAASIGWTLAAQTPVGAVNLVVRTVLTLNLITGRILAQRDSWTFASTAPHVALLFSTQRLLYNLSQNARSAAADAGKAADAASASSDSQIYGDPTDPMKFFQMQDRSFEDGVQIALLLAVMYTIVQALRLTNGV